MAGIPIESIAVGDAAELTRTITESDVFVFAGVTMDQNPVHLDEEVAKSSIFRGRVVHGVFAAGLISAVLGNHLPGHGTIYLSQTLKFLAPIRIGETIVAQVVVESIDTEKNRVTLRTTCSGSDGSTFVDGIAVVIPPR